jgi:hypothetical protein
MKNEEIALVQDTMEKVMKSHSNVIRYMHKRYNWLHEPARLAVYQKISSDYFVKRVQNQEAKELENQYYNWLDMEFDLPHAQERHSIIITAICNKMRGVPPNSIPYIQTYCMLDCIMRGRNTWTERVDALISTVQGIDPDEFRYYMTLCFSRILHKDPWELCWQSNCFICRKKNYPCDAFIDHSDKYRDLSTRCVVCFGVYHRTIILFPHNP